MRQKRKILTLLSASFVLACILFGLFLRSGAASSTDSLVGYWKFEETTAADSKTDSSGDSRTGSPSGTVLPQPATSPAPTNYGNGRSLVFGNTNNAINVTSANPIDDMPALSTSAWIYPTSYAGESAEGRIIDKTNSVNGWSFFVDDGALHFYANFSTSPLDKITTATLPTNTWANVAVTWDGTSNASGVKIYIDGVEQTSFATETSGSGSRVSDDTYNVIIGNNSALNRSFAGNLDEVRLYNRQLSDNEVSNIGQGDHPESVWTGSVSSDYENASNWNTGAIPDPYAVVSIPDTANNPVASANLSLAGLEIGSGGFFNLVGYNMTVNDGGSFSNQGTLQLRNSQTLSGFTNDSDSGTILMTPNGDTTGLKTGNNFFNLIINDSTLSHWPLDETSGTSSVDISGYQADATHNGGPTISSNVADTNFANDRSLEFDGSDDYLSFDEKTIPANSTWCAWTNMQSGSGAVIGSDTPGHYALAIYGGNEVRAYAQAGVDEAAWSVASLYGNWHHLCITQTTTGSAALALYIDGVSQGGSETLTSGIGSANRIGSDGTDFFDGNIDDVRIYNRVLTGTEIGRLAAGNQPETNLYRTTLGAAANVNGSLTINSGIFDVSTSNYGLDIGGDFSNNGGVFQGRNGSVVLDGSDQQISSTASFYNLTKQVASAATLEFGRGTTTTITNQLTLNGAAGQLLSLRSSTSGVEWNIDSTGSETISYLDVQDSNNVDSEPIDITNTNTTDSGNNTNWTVNVSPNSPSSLGSTNYVNGSFVGDSSPTLTFNLSDPNATDEVRYRVQIDTDSDFSSPVVDYTSALGAQGARSFTVGQNDDDDTYDVGTDGMTLPTANYYWQVKAIDGYLTPNESSYTVANSGSVAFQLDVTPPTNPGTPSSSDTQTERRPTWTWSASTDAGVGIGSPTYTLQWSKDSNFLTGVSSNTTNNTTFTHGSNLSDGYWYFRVRAADSLGNNSSWSTSTAHLIDTTGPTTPVAPYTSSPTNFNQPTWSWSAPTDAGVGLAATPYTVQWSQDSSFVSGVNSTTTANNNYAHTSALADATWYFRVRAVDAIGNNSAWSASGSVLIDSSPPSLPGSPYTADPTNDNTPTWTWDASIDTGVGLTANPYTIQWSSDPGFSSVAGSTSSSTNSFTNGGSLTDGTWYIRVNARDTLSNQSAYSDVGQATIDTVAPDVIDTPTTTTPTNDPTPSWNWAVPDDTGVGLSDTPYEVEWSQDEDFNTVTGSDTLANNSFTHTSDLAEGTWYFRVRSTDEANNTASYSANGEVYIDVTAPTVPGDPSTSDPVNDNTPSWNWTASTDGGIGLDNPAYEVQWSTDNTFVSGVSSSTASSNSFTHSGALADGTWYFRVRAVDDVGNRSGWSNAGSKVVDIDPPSVPGTPTTTSPTNDNTPTWNWTASTDDGVGLDEEPYTIEWSQNSNFLSGVTSDTITPSSFTHPDPLADGTWYFRVRASDDVGNNSAYSSNGTVIVDATAPTVPGAPSTASPTVDSTPTWTWAASNDGAGTGLDENAYIVEWSLFSDFSDDVSGSNSTTNSFTHSTPLADGTWYFRIRAVDNVNNESANSTVGSVEVDDTAPSVPGTPSTSTPTDDVTPSWTWTASTDNGVGLDNPAYDLQWSQDSGFGSGIITDQTNTNNFTHPDDLADGTWYFRVRATDNLGNASAYSSSGSVLISTDGPTVPGTPSAGASQTTDNTPSWTWTPSTSDAGLASPAYYLEWSQDINFLISVQSSSTVGASFTHSSTLADGTWYFRVRAEDNTGIFSNYSSPGSILVDTQAPSVPASISTATPTNDTTPTWTWDSSIDDGSGLATTPYEVQWSQQSDFSNGVTSSSGNQNNFTHTSTLTDGTWYFRVRAEDAVGNQSSYSAGSSVVIDSTAPSTPGQASTTTPTNDTTPTWTWTASTDSGVGLDDPAYLVEWSQSSSFSSGVSSDDTNSNNFTHTSTLTDGTWYFRVRAVDGVANQSPWSSNGQVVVDNSVPTVPGTPSVGHESTNDTTPTWTWTASTDSGVGLDDPAYLVEWSQDSGFLSGVSGDDSSGASFTHASDLPSGTWYFRVRAVDEVGNQSGWSANGSVFVDTQTPTSPGTPGVTSSPTTDTTPTWTWTASTDGGFGFGDEPYELQWSQDSGFGSGVSTGQAANESFTHSSTLADGTWYFRVRAVDDAGNQSGWSSHGDVTIDATAPTVPGTPATTTPTKDSTPSWTWTASTDSGVGLDDPAYEIEWSDNSGFNSNVISQTTNAESYTHSTELDFGVWYFRVRSVDNLSNKSAWSSSSVYIDNTPPVITSINATAGSGGAVITWTTDEIASSRVIYSAGDSFSQTTVEQNTSPRVTSHSVTVTGLGSCSTFNFKVVSIDQLDNESTSGAGSFTTTACSGNSAITGQSRTSITSGGGQTSLNGGTAALQLVVPPGAVGDSADFQIKQLSPASALSGIGQPSGRHLIGSHVYDMKAVLPEGVLITSFNGGLSVAITYTVAEVSGFDISSLAIFRHDGSSWQQLSGCSVNAVARLTTCQTGGFSVFGLFGVRSVATPAPSLPEGAGTVEPDPLPETASPANQAKQSDKSATQAANDKRGLSALFSGVVDSIKKRTVWWLSALLIIASAGTLLFLKKRQPHKKQNPYGIHKDE